MKIALTLIPAVLVLSACVGPLSQENFEQTQFAEVLTQFDETVTDKLEVIDTKATEIEQDLFLDFNQSDLDENFSQ